MLTIPLRYTHAVPRPPAPLDRPPVVTFDDATIGTASEADGGGALGGGLVLMQRFGATVDDPEFAFLVHLIVAAREGRLVSESVSVRARAGGPPVTSTDLRAVKLDAYLACVRERLISTHGHFLVMRRTREDEGTTYVPVAADEWEGITNGPERRQPATDVLQAVTAAYREALRSADPVISSSPTAHVASKLGYSRGHAARLVAKARKTDGLLGNAYRGRPGEMEDT